MKKLLRSTLVRALCVLALGVVLIVFAKDVTLWLVRLCGLLFIVPGSVALLAYFVRRGAEAAPTAAPAQKEGIPAAGDGKLSAAAPHNASPSLLYPVAGAGSILFGVVLLAWPAQFVDALTYLFAAILLLAAASQYYTLWDMHRNAVAVPAVCYIMPAVQLSAGLFIYLSPDKLSVAGLPMTLLGSAFALYALVELYTLYLLSRRRKALEKGIDAPQQPAQ